MALAMVSKEKMAAKEADRKEAAHLREERQAKLDQMNIDRDIQLKKLRNDQKAKLEANALERLQVQDNIVDQEEKIQAAVMLNVEEKAFLFIQLPEDMRWVWLKKEITSK
ncbi:hypothetical protein DFH28DRAFT_1079265 [Melampsora americana]|nr:hypothetical protein DFH28DRAFT_1079265 [Melampsora americana]